MSLQEATLDHLEARHGRLMSQEDVEESKDWNDVGVKLWKLRKTCAKFISVLCDNIEADSYSDNEDFAEVVAHIKRSNDLIDQITVDIEVIDDMLAQENN